MTSLEFETEDMQPVNAVCADGAVHVTLANGRTISAPLWWTRIDEAISVKSIYLGEKARDAVAPGKAA